MAHSWVQGADGLRRCAGCGRTEHVETTRLHGQLWRQTIRMLAPGLPSWECTGLPSAGPEQARGWWQQPDPAYPEQGAWERPAPSAPQWEQPYLAAGYWVMLLQEWSAPGVLARAGNVYWAADGTGFYKISMTYEGPDGIGLPCWPSFRALWAAQEYVEGLWALPRDEVIARHGGPQWNRVIPDDDQIS